MSITLWKPEPDVIIHQALGKACEEASELANILARCLIQGLDQSEPVSGKPNRQALFEEIADLDAAVQWLRELVDDEYDGDRADRKLNGFRRWQRMLEEDMQEVPYICDACAGVPGYAPNPLPEQIANIGKEGGSVDNPIGKRG
ncbi:hypothetical protein [Rhizobium rhizogenes]|uniref:hypothetical protein n=1 Tax=Rhizobium rhizogenes TaxID=359 RepID=UPI001F430094|nr:hypothetical protein [Rhizobium rhizogenes]